MSELIDREAVLDECVNHYEVGNIEQNCTMDWICKTVRNFPAASPWHRVDDPPKGYGAFAACCVYDGKIYWFKAIYLDGKWLREMDGVELPVNYWMEIPEPPKEDA